MTLTPGRNRHPDAALVTKALAMEIPASEELAKRMRCIPRILRAHNRRLGGPLDEHELADASQDSLIVIWRKLGEYDGSAPLEAWVYRICIYEMMNGLRKKWRRSDHVTSAERAILEDAPDRPPTQPWKHEGLHQALTQLPPQEAQVVRDKHFEGMTLDAIAARDDTPSSTIKSRYYRALTRLQAALREDLP